MANLFDIATEYKEKFLELIELDLDEETLNDTLDSISSDFESKALNVSAFFQNVEADIEAMKKAEKNIAERRKAKENKVKRLREYLLNNMIETGITKIECPEFCVSVRKGSKDSVVVYEGDPKKLEGDCVKVTYTPNKTEIKKRLKAGEVIEGASLKDGAPSLMVK